MILVTEGAAFDAAALQQLAAPLRKSGCGRYLLRVPGEKAAP